MPGHFQHFEIHPQKIFQRRRLDEQVGLDRLNLELEAVVAKVVAVGDHRSALRVNPDRATEAAFDFRHVLDVIDVAVGEQEEPQLNSLSDEPGAGAVGRIEEDPTFRRLQRIAVCLENSPGKSAVRDHAVLVRALARNRNRARTPISPTKSRLRARS